MIFPTTGSTGANSPTSVSRSACLSVAGIISDPGAAYLLEIAPLRPNDNDETPLASWRGGMASYLGNLTCHAVSPPSC